MRILMVAPPSFPVSASTGSSVEICMLEIGRRLSKHHQVTIISRASAGLPSQSRLNKLRIIRIPVRGYWQKVIHYAKIRTFDFIQVDNRPEAVSLLKSHLPSARIVLNLHSLTFMRKLSAQRQRRVMKDAHAILCNSHYIKNHYRKLFPPYTTKIHAIQLGTDTSRFKPPTLAEKYRLRARFSVEDTFNILYCGRIIPQKGVELLIQAAAITKKKYPFIRVVLVGPSSQTYLRKIISLAKRLHVPLSIAGKMKPSLTHRAYWLGDCLVFPTQFKEAFGLVNVEAMASGLPVIASHRGGIPEILKGGNGITVRDYRNPQAFSRAIIQLISSPSQKRKLAGAGQRTALQRYSWKRVAADYHRFYSRLL